MSAATNLARRRQGRPVTLARPGGPRPSRKPLFLGAALRGQVTTDGPALRVRAERRAETRFPLDRVSRLVAIARVSWSAEALRACLENAIPIVIVGADGSPLGSVQPARLRNLLLAGALEELLDCPGWRDIYGGWLRSARMRVLAGWRQARQAAGAAPDALTYQALVKKHVYGARPASAPQDMTGLWRSALYAMAVQTTQRWGVPALLWGSGGEALDLRRDLAELLELRLRLEVSQEAEATLKGDATMLFVLQAMTEKLELEASRAMRSLARRVRQVLAEWR